MSHISEAIRAIRLAYSPYMNHPLRAPPADAEGHPRRVWSLQHDVIFLNAVTTDTIQLANQHLATFKGNYVSAFQKCTAPAWVELLFPIESHLTPPGGPAGLHRRGSRLLSPPLLFRCVFPRKRATAHSGNPCG